MTTNTKQYDRYASMVKTQRKQQYQHRVRYTDPGTGQEMFTGLCRDLNDAMLKAAFLGGTVIDDDDGKANDDSYTYSADGKMRINKNGNFGF